MPCCVMLCCEECPATDVHSVLRYVALQHGLRTETCRSVFKALICKFYVFYIRAVVGIIIE